MPETTLTINHADGGSETYTINRDKFEGVRTMDIDGVGITLDRTAPERVRNIIVNGETIVIDTTREGIRTLTVDGSPVTIDRDEEANLIVFLNQLWTRPSQNLFNKADAVDNTGGGSDWNSYFQSASIDIIGGESYHQSSGEAIIREYDAGSTAPDHLTLQSGSGTDYSNLMWFGGSQYVNYSATLAALSASNNFSVSFNWISGSDTTSLQYLIGHARSSTNAFVVQISPNAQLSSYIYNGSYAGQTSISYEPNTLYFVTVVKNGSDTFLTLNGTPSGAYAGLNFKPSSGFGIGARNTGSAPLQGGSIWNVKVYSDTTFTTQIFGAAGEGTSNTDWDDNVGSLNATVVGSPSAIGTNTGDVSTSAAGSIVMQPTTTSASILAPISLKDSLMFKKGSTPPASYEAFGNIVDSFGDYRLEMVSYGDSLTNGNSWQPTLASELNLGHLRLGVGGRRITGSSGMAAQTSVDTISITSNIIIAMGGTNDWVGAVALGSPSSTDISEFYGALNLMVDRIAVRNPQAQLLLMTPPYSEDKPPTRWSGFTDNITNGIGLTLSDYSEAIKTVAAAKGVPVVDNYNNSWDETNITTYMVDDGNYIHPNAAGGEIIANNAIQGLINI